MLFVALRFAEDENIADRVYWYASDFPVKEGECVLAPVGVRNRLQRAVVEKTLSCEAEKAPYDLSLIKYVAAKYGARKLPVASAAVRDLGGIRYDCKRYTRLGKVLCGRTADLLGEQDERLLADYGVTDKVFFSAHRVREDALNGDAMVDFWQSESAQRAMACIVRSHGCVLLLDGADTVGAQMVATSLLSLHGVAEREIMRDAETVGRAKETKNLLTAFQAIGGAEKFLTDAGVAPELIERLKTPLL